MARLAHIGSDGVTVVNVSEGDPANTPNAIDVTGTKVSKYWSYDSSTGEFNERWMAKLDGNNVVEKVRRGNPSMFPDDEEVTGKDVKPGHRKDGSAWIAPEPPPKSWKSKDNFLREFTRQERNAIRAASQSDDTVGDFMFMLDAASGVFANDPLVTEGMQYLVDQGFITDARRNEILSNG